MAKIDGTRRLLERLHRIDEDLLQICDIFRSDRDIFRSDLEGEKARGPIPQQPNPT
jgi:hypothetical protein